MILHSLTVFAKEHPDTNHRRSHAWCRRRRKLHALQPQLPAPQSRRLCGETTTLLTEAEGLARHTRALKRMQDRMARGRLAADGIEG